MLEQQEKLEEEADQQQFYSFNNSKQSFTFIEEQPSNLLDQNISEMPEEQWQHHSNHNNHYKKTIKQSSFQDDDSSSHQQFHSIHHHSDHHEANLEENNLSMSIIKHSEIQQNLEHSICLLKDIQCLEETIHQHENRISQQDYQNLQDKILALKKQQENILSQLGNFKQMIQINQNNGEQIKQQVKEFTRKNKVEIAPAKENKLRGENAKIANQQIKSNKPRLFDKHYDIKPKMEKNEEEMRRNIVYKSCAFNKSMILFEDPKGQYRVDIEYHDDYAEIFIIESSNTNKKQNKNYSYGIKIKNAGQTHKIEQKVRLEMMRHEPKKFTCSLGVYIKIMKTSKIQSKTQILNGQPQIYEGESDIVQILSTSVPLPLNYFIEKRYASLTTTPIQKTQFISNIRKKLYILQIDINYNADIEAYERLSSMDWMQNNFITLKGSQQLLWVELGRIEEVRNNTSMQKQNNAIPKKVKFYVGSRNKNSPEVVDLIEYLCFMLTF